MTSFSQLQTSQKIYTIIRVLLGLGFFAFGMMKFIDLLQGGAMYGNLGDVVTYVGLEPSAGRAWFVALSQVIGGLMLIVGLFTRIASLLMVEIMIMALIALSHGFGGIEITLWIFTIPGIFFYLSALFLFRGAGPYSLDTKRNLCFICKLCQQCSTGSCKK